MIPRISDCLSCNYQFARKFYKISNLVWNEGDDLSKYKDVEQDMIKYISKLKSERNHIINYIDYRIDGRGIPRLEYRMLKIK